MSFAHFIKGARDLGSSFGANVKRWGSNVGDNLKHRSIDLVRCVYSRSKAKFIEGENIYYVLKAEGASVYKGNVEVRMIVVSGAVLIALTTHWMERKRKIDLEKNIMKMKTEIRYIHYKYEVVMNEKNQMAKEMREKIGEVEDRMRKMNEAVKQAHKADMEAVKQAHKADMEAVKEALLSKRVNAYVTPMPMRDQLHFEAMQYEFKMKAFGLK